jgi:serine protease Do
MRFRLGACPGRTIRRVGETHQVRKNSGVRWVSPARQGWSLTFCVAIGIVLTLSQPIRSYGQQVQIQTNRQQGPSAQQGQNVQQQPVMKQDRGQPGQHPWVVADYYKYNPPKNATDLRNVFWTLTDADQMNSGMSLSSADDALRAQLKLPKEEGLIVTAVAPGSSAAMAGIESNDILLRIGGKVPQGLPLGKPEDLEEGLKAAGDAPVGLLLLRRGQRLGLKVQPRVRVSLGPVQPDPPSYWIGVSVGSVEPALRVQLQLQKNHGLIALDVVKDGPGAKAGVRPHDILLKLDGEELTDQDKLIQVVQAKGEKTVPLELVREGKKETIGITPQRRKSINFTVSWDKPKTATYDWVFTGTPAPGQAGPRGNVGSGMIVADYNNDGNLDLWMANQASPSNQPRDGDPATARRLDDLTAQIKELRQAVEALTKAPQLQKK